jgi:hypothetical protein
MEQVPTIEWQLFSDIPTFQKLKACILLAEAFTLEAEYHFVFYRQKLLVI